MRHGQSAEMAALHAGEAEVAQVFDEIGQDLHAAARPDAPIAVDAADAMPAAEPEPPPTPRAPRARKAAPTEGAATPKPRTRRTKAAP
jgi:hypothetical protein